MPANTCQNCKWYEDMPDGFGICHKYAPRPIQPRGDSTDNHPPTIHRDYWCGDWSKKTGPTLLSRIRNIIKI